VTATLGRAQPRARDTVDRGRAGLSGGGAQRRWSWVAIGVLVMLGTGLVFYLWVQRIDQRVGVVVSSRTIQPGEVVAEEDLRVTEVGEGDLGEFLLADQAREVAIGRPAAALIPEGSFVHPAQFGTVDALAQGQTVVGAVLEPGGYPTLRLGPGQNVVMLETRDAQSSGGTGGGRQLGVAEVYAAAPLVGPSVGTEALFVSLVVDDADAIAVADAAASERLRLVLLPGDVDPSTFQLPAAPTITDAPTLPDEEGAAAEEEDAAAEDERTGG
jgi:hypothetical protein